MAPGSRTENLFSELRQLIEHSGADTPSQPRDLDSTPYPPLAHFPPAKMVGKKSGRALLREEGLERTDNDLEISSWPQVQMINQKNYYTEYLKRDDQYLAYRTLQEENSNRLRKEALDRARNGVPMGENGAPLENDVPMEDAEETAGGLNEPHGSKIIVIHPGSQNLRIGFANDALPKTVPMCIARKSTQNESEANGGEPAPKRIKIDDEVPEQPDMWFGEDFKTKYDLMASDLKVRMRNNKRRLLPNSKELVHNWNRKADYEEISEHNDPHRIEWTEILPGKAPKYFTGHDALRLPEQSRPRYRLTWPLRCGWFNEQDYSARDTLLNDFFLIIEDAIQSQLGVSKREWPEYSCCFVIPDLYERKYVTMILEALMREFQFRRVCFIQESLAASFGAGYSMACIVDVGAQKTSICCVEDGLCIEDSRINLKYGGRDVTELFIKMMLFDHFPYADINLKRRYDFLLAEELKQKFCTMNEGEISVQVYDFHLRAANQDTRKYVFKTYDEPMLAPMGYFNPDIFDHSEKLNGRRKVIDRAYDLYDGQPNDPYSIAQSAALAYSSQNVPAAVAAAPEPTIITATATPSKPKPFNLLSRLPQDDTESTPRSSVAGSPAPEVGTPQPRDSPGPAGADASFPSNSVATIDKATESIRAAEERDRILPILPLDTAIITSIREASKGEERKMRDFFGGIMLVGGGAKIPQFNNFLETKLREVLPGFTKEIIIGLPPRELDQQLVVWKGGSVFARLSSSGNDSWVFRKEYEMLGSKLLAQKCMWNW